MLDQGRRFAVTSQRGHDGYIVDAGLGFAALCCACILLARLFQPLPQFLHLLEGPPPAVSLACLLAMSGALLAIRRHRPRLAVGLTCAVPLLCVVAALAFHGLAGPAEPSPTGRPLWYAPPHLACIVILLSLDLTILLSVPQRPFTSRVAVLLACMVTGAGLSTLFGLRLHDGSMLLSPMGGMLTTILGATVINTNYMAGWRELQEPANVDAPILRIIFLLVLLAPVALGTLGYRLSYVDMLRPDLITIFAICLHILLGILLLFWVWDRIGRGMAAQRSLIRTLDTAPIAITDVTGRIRYWSKGCEALYGWSGASARGQRKQILLGYGPSAERSVVPSGDAEVNEVELMERRRDGRIVHVREQSRMLGPDKNGELLLALVMADVTEQHMAQARQAEMREELIHASRLSNIGEAAAGLAHELRQPLAAASNFLGIAELMLDRPEQDPERLRATLMLASEQTLRAGEIVQRFQAFLTKRPDHIRAEPIADTIRGAIGLAATGMDARRTRVEYRHHSRYECMMADRVQIQQVLLNLIRNAIEAQVAAEVEEPFVHITADDMEGDVIRITVRDSGPGIADEVLRASYRPFTSTKEDGMGLGLSICRRIVESHGGAIHAENMADGGAMIWFTIPAAMQAAPVS